MLHKKSNHYDCIIDPESNDAQLDVTTTKQIVAGLHKHGRAYFLDQVWNEETEVYEYNKDDVSLIQRTEKSDFWHLILILKTYWP